MKLLSKQDVSKAKSADKQREIEEGLKLAKRVDALREVVAQEDASLQKFRSETLSKITSEILSETKKRDGLLKEVADLEDRKATALEPLTEELEMIESKRALLQEDQYSLEVAEASIRLNEADLADRETEVLKAEQAVSYAQVDARDRLEKADTLKIEAERLHRVANETLLTSQTQAAATSNKLEEREQWVSDREKVAFANEEELRIKEIDLAKEFSRLKDREAVLARNLKRNG